MMIGDLEIRGKNERKKIRYKNAFYEEGGGGKEKPGHRFIVFFVLFRLVYERLSYDQYLQSLSISKLEKRERRKTRSKIFSPSPPFYHSSFSSQLKFLYTMIKCFPLAC